MTDYDAIIVGGGPAGASAAIDLASAGARVLVAERESFPREKLCGEFISPECLAHFGRLGVLGRKEQGGGARVTVARAGGGRDDARGRQRRRRARARRASAHLTRRDARPPRAGHARRDGPEQDGRAPRGEGTGRRREDG